MWISEKKFRKDICSDEKKNKVKFQNIGKKYCRCFFNMTWDDKFKVILFLLGREMKFLMKYEWRKQEKEIYSAKQEPSQDAGAELYYDLRGR